MCDRIAGNGGEGGDSTVALKSALLELGFDRVGVAPADDVPDFERYAAWVAAGNAAGMEYLETAAAPRRSPRELLPEARSVIMVSLNYYHPSEAVSAIAGTGLVSRYARGRDYHKVLGGRLRAAARLLEERFSARHTRICVDTAPLLERSLAARAGLGWIGRNTMLIDPELGSWTFLGALLTDLDFPPDEPVADRCGTCRACLAACPTGALSAAADGSARLDARRCLSYLSIEHDGAIEPALADGMGDLVFGCDLCQEVCPWNRKPVVTGVADFRPRTGQTRLDLNELQTLEREGFLERFAGSPLMRAGVERMARNAAICLANAERRDSDDDGDDDL